MTVMTRALPRIPQAALAKMLALAMLFAQAPPVPMAVPIAPWLELYSAADICRNAPSQPGVPPQKCDACCWGHCHSSAPALPPGGVFLILIGAWVWRKTVTPMVRVGDKRILDAPLPRGPPPAIAH